MGNHTRPRVLVKRYDPTPKTPEFRLECLTAFYAGESYDKIAARLPVSIASIRNWRKDYPQLDAAARIAGARIKAEREAAKQALIAEHEAWNEKARREHEAYRARIWEANAEALARMSDRAREICTAAFNGASGEAIARAQGVSRERVRQIVLYWRVRGFEIPDAKPMSEASLRVARQSGHGKSGRQKRSEISQDDPRRWLAFPAYVQEKALRRKIKPSSPEITAWRREHMRKLGLARRKYGLPQETSK